MRTPAPPRPSPRLVLGLLGAALLIFGAGDLALGDPPGAGTLTPPKPTTPAETTPPPPVPDPLRIGVFPAEPLRVIDADTLRVEGQPSIRVLGIDAEETFKNDNHRAAAARDFAAYAREMRGDAKRPVKYGTPMGEEATRRVRELMGTATTIRLEREEAKGRDQDGFGRLLAHVFVTSPDREVHLSEWLIRQGLAPYFVKYGRSKRFDATFRAAQTDAQAAKRGIWGDEGPAHYPDYDERLIWWRFRAAQLESWHAAPTASHRVALGQDDTTPRLKDLLGKEAIVFGSLERLHQSDKTTRKILFLSHRRKQAFPAVVFDMEVWRQLDLDAITSLYITVRGTVTDYRGRPQIVVSDPDQIQVPR